MNPARLWRTARHLSAEQWLFRAVNLLRRRAMSTFPGAAEARIAHLADRLPVPDATRPALCAAAAPVLALQTAVHGGNSDGIRNGRVTLHNEEFDFGAPGRWDWRGDFREGDNPRRRKALAYV